ncbi:hypothetical protein [Planomonospora parontospora]|uniref:hypothetical protein n=1 Tax=Planomonospora parontospora TaxID=58119 RepID=UPI00166F9766|nr:hypothetical protein [Planomonospora parontospora]GGL22659.1 hypothetical protein GCM10014719_25800 [Planomonospora parontospora subsp. antibiotica]GII14944.1 hypothetical protein Ppa05_16700 [Planomonospora parontospora subsp. antibiotica]
MARSELAAAVQDGLEERNPEVSIRRVKEAVRKGLLAIDKTPKVHETEYFNHSYAPDFILSWPGSQTSNRPVYLKFADDPAYLAEEVELVAQQHPMVIELDINANQKQTKDQESIDRLREVARGSDTLITNPDGLTEIEAEQRNQPILRLLGRALLQGGRGVIDEHLASQTSQTLATGVEAAQSLDAEPTRRAAEVLEDVLSGPSQSRIQRFLQALWVGSGGAESTFPGETALSGPLDDDALAFLIETEGVADSAEFWRRIGSRLTIDQIGRLPIPPRHFPNLQYLVDANIDRLWGRVVKVSSHGLQTTLDAHEYPTPWWAVRNSLLCLIGDSYEALIGTLSEQLEHISINSQEPSIEELIERAKSNDIRLGELVLKNGKRFMSYGSEDNEDVSGDPNLLNISTSLGPSATVTSAVASLSRGKHLKVHFSRALATTEGPAKIPLRELVLTAVPLLRDYVSSTESRLMDTLAEEPGAPTLF